MKLFLSYLRLVRPFNLFMILFTLYMVRGFFLFSTNELTPHSNVSEVVYALFSLSFVFMAAGGYIINDYYDVEIDKINKPGSVIIGNSVSIPSALTTYWLVNICGIITGFCSCYRAGIPVLGTLFLFYFVGLWFYSYKLKSTFLIGNILIGIFLALVPLGGACIELCLNTLLGRNEKILVWQLMGGISLFAFLSTLIREIVKDAEDMEGDKIAGCHTMPIVIGIKKTRWLVFSLLVLLNAPLVYIHYKFHELGIYPLIYFLLFIQAPFLVIYYRVLKASVAADFHKISSWIKLLMVTSIIYVFALAFEVYSTIQFINALFN